MSGFKMVDKNMANITAVEEPTAEASSTLTTEIEKFENDIEDIANLIDDDLISSDPSQWIRMQIANNADPRVVISQLIPELAIPDDVDDISLWRVAFNILTEPPVRECLPNINSLDDVKQLIKDCKNIIVLTGAGVSVSCGIPDFRSRDGIYARLSKDYPDLPDPQSMFDIHYFRINQWPFFKFAKEIYPGQYTPSLCHRFISYLDKTGRLLRNYSQNIDTLEQVAGIQNVVQCHGSFATATCMNCKLQVKAEDIKEDIFDQKIPYCNKCKIDDEDEVSLNVIKPDIVFFGESLPQAFHKQIEEDKDKVDLLIVIGSSLKVRPVSLIPSLIKPDVPQILINREPLNHLSFDVELYGNCDDIIAEICTQLGSDWTDVIGDFVQKPLDSKKLSLLFDAGKNYNEINDEKDEEVNENPPTLIKNNENEQSADSSINDNITIKVKEEVTNSSNINSSTTDDERKNLKRKCECKSESEIEVSSKKLKIQQEQTEEKEEIYYLSLPPNRYLFNGAEIDADDDSETETETETEGDDEEQCHTHQTENGVTENVIDDCKLEHNLSDNLPISNNSEQNDISIVEKVATDNVVLKKPQHGHASLAPI